MNRPVKPATDVPARATVRGAVHRKGARRAPVAAAAITASLAVGLGLGPSVDLGAGLWLGPEAGLRPVIDAGLGARLHRALGRDIGPASGLALAQDAPLEAWGEVARLTAVDAPPAPGEFRAPAGVTVGPDGTIYVADGGLGGVHVLAADGSPRGFWRGGGALGDVRDVAIGSSGGGGGGGGGGDELFVSEPDEGAVHVLATADGAYLRRLDVPGGPNGLAFGGGMLYVTTADFGEVRVLAPYGSLVDRWDDTMSPLTQPWGIDFGGDGRIYVADMADRVVYIFDPDGIVSGGVIANADGLQMTPIDVAVEQRDTPEVFLISDLHLARVKDGAPLSVPYASPGGRGIALGPGPGLVMAVQDFRQGFTGLRRMRDRRAALPIVDAWGGPFAPLGTLEHPRRLGANADDRVFVLDAWPRVQSWDAAGTPRSQFGVGSIQDLAAGLRGSAYAIDGRSMAFRSEDGAALWTWQPPSTSPDTGYPWGWLTHADGFAGDVLALDTGDQHAWRLDFSGNRLSDWAVSPPDGFTSIADIALGPENVVLINRGAGALESRDRATGDVRAAWTVPGRPRRVDVLPDGSTAVLLDQGWVWLLGADGELRSVWQAADERQATDVAAADDDLVWVARSDGDVVGYGPQPGAAPPEVPEFEDRCRLTHDKRASPARVELGDSVTIELSVDGDCPLSDAAADILLLLDTSGSMGGSKAAAARTAILEFLGQLDYSLHQVGLITFESEASVVQTLTNNPRTLIAAAPTLGGDSGTNMLAAMELAEIEFVSSRRRPDAKPVIVVLSDGRPNSDVAGLIIKSDGFRAIGGEIYTIGLGLDVARDFMRRFATDPDFYFEAPTEYELTEVYETIARRVAASRLLRSIEVSDVLPPDMEYVRRSAAPPARFDPETRQLTWDLTGIGSTGVNLRYRVRPSAAGVRPTNELATADYIDGVGFAGRLVFPVPEVEVFAPEVWTAYLPTALNRQCPEARIDVVLALDTSTSMREPLPGGGTGLEAAVQAARGFLRQLRFPRDRAALVAFSGDGRIVAPLGDDLTALADALSALPEGSGTRIDAGLAQARAAIGSPRPARVSAIVLLTDGRQSGAPVAAALAEAEAARADGILVYTIGLGPAADMDALRVIAGDERRAYFAPDETELAAIYAAIASAIPCE